jgi:hypothetical protein
MTQTRATAGPFGAPAGWPSDGTIGWVVLLALGAAVVAGVRALAGGR